MYLEERKEYPKTTLKDRKEKNIFFSVFYYFFNRDFLLNLFGLKLMSNFHFENAYVALEHYHIVRFQR